ncbi:MAG TPA: BMP family ABC transporter substrate-binding protein [Ottowia sp.]|jgi:basic membrane protein A|nr:BMP family ABC transporter substrate-binding protein [Ottowia sp.]HMT65051.1 BMP family ABC transporter substrate-binding protein [Ottowia sp.]HQZ57341.1 BMP family ABC transporter substrate-binding protein [Ottowia sp.]
MYKNLVAALAAACFFPPLHAQTQPPTRAAWVYVTPVLDTGWTRQHEQGRLAVQKALGDQVKTSYVDNVAEGADAERVIRDLARQGNDIIFTTSFGYMEPALKVAQEFPRVKFEVITGVKRAPNVATANARYYEGRYLSGVAAGRMTKSNVVGYVAGFPIPEIVSSINAFTLGLRSVNPQATVKLVWLNEWFNPPREREAAMTLMDQGADVLAFNTASTAVMAAAEERGQLAIAYHSDMRGVAPHAQLAAVTHHWEDYDMARVRALRAGTWIAGVRGLRAGTWKSQDTWGGVKDGMVRIEAFGPKVPPAVQKEVLARQQDIAAGRLLPFAGPVVDNTGHVQVPKGRSASDREILEMNYLVEGVQGSISR